MLTPEQAQQRLQAAIIPNLVQWRVEAIRTLPDAHLSEKIHKLYVQWLKEDIPASTNLQTIAFGLIGHDADGKALSPNESLYYFYSEHSRAVHNGSTAALAALLPKDRIQIFQVFFPKSLFISINYGTLSINSLIKADIHAKLSAHRA